MQLEVGSECGCVSKSDKDRVCELRLCVWYFGLVTKLVIFILSTGECD